MNTLGHTHKYTYIHMHDVTHAYTPLHTWITFIFIHCLPSLLSLILGLHTTIDSSVACVPLKWFRTYIHELGFKG